MFVRMSPKKDSETPPPTDPKKPSIDEHLKPSENKKASKSKSIEEVVVVSPDKSAKKEHKAKNAKFNLEKNEKISLQPPKRSASDTNLLLKRDSSFLTTVSHASATENWNKIARHLRAVRKKDKSAKEREVLEAFKRAQKEKPVSRFEKWKPKLRKLSCLFYGPMFYRHRFSFIIFLEVFFPIIIFITITWAFTSSISWKKAYLERKEAEAYARKVEFKPIYPDELMEKFKNAYADKAGRVYIAFTPYNNFTESLIGHALKLLKLDVVNKIPNTNYHSSFGAVGVESSQEVLEHCFLHRQDMQTHKLPIGLEFTYSLTHDDESSRPPSHLLINIRTFEPKISSTRESNPYVKPPKYGKAWIHPYIETGFLGLQYALQRAFTELHYEERGERMERRVKIMEAEGQNPAQEIENGPMDPTDPSFPGVAFRVLLTPNYFDKAVRNLITFTLCIILCLSYIALSYFIVQQIVTENQSGIKDLLIMHHMPKYYHWIIYLLHSVLFRTITAAGITITLFFNYGSGAIFTYSHWFIVQLIIWSHLMSLSSFNFFIGTFIKSVSLSGVCSVTFCIFTFAVPYWMETSGILQRELSQITALIFPNWALYNIIAGIVDFECDNIGINWRNLNEYSNIDDHLSCIQVLFIMFGTTIFYFLCAMALDLLPKSGQHSSFNWYSLFQSLCYVSCGKKKERKRGVSIFPVKKGEGEGLLSATGGDLKDYDEDDDEYGKPLIYEKMGNKELKSHVKVRNVSKVFGKHRQVLDNVSIDFYSSEITVVLGHGDSGKSTLINIIAGLIKPTTGNVYINGVNINKDLANAKKYIGLCPQEVILFNLLTVKEHLILCYKLRGSTTKDAKNFTAGLLELLRLGDVGNFTPNSLTEDEKRKLSIAMCLVDEPSIILLDEPTQEMEPIARHEIWNILKNLRKEGHTIILTTNVMDEAEFLSDRVALFSYGKLICYGTPRYLKQQYDTGYYLKIIPNPVIFNLNSFQQVATKHFEGPLKEAPQKTMSDSSNFLLMLPKKHLKKFPAFFTELEEKKSSLGLLSYGTQTVTLSDIFIKVSEESSLHSSPTDIYIHTNSKGASHSALGEDVPVLKPSERIVPSPIVQFHTLLHKLFIFGSGGQLWLIIWGILIPLFMIWLTLLHSHIFIQPPRSPVTREFNLSNFPTSRVYYKISGLIRNGTNDHMGWMRHIPALLGPSGEEVKTSERFETIVLQDIESSKLNKTYSLERRMIGIEVSKESGKKEELVGYYASGSLHSPPLLLSLIGNLHLKSMTRGQGEEVTLRVSNTPFPTLVTDNQGDYCGLTCMSFSLLISISIGFFSALFMSFPLHERASKMKLVQMMAGLRPIVYWGSYYAFHLIISAILTVCVVLVFLFDTAELYVLPETWGTVLVIVALYLCWSSLPWVYFLSTTLPEKSEGSGIGFFIHIMFAFLPVVILDFGLEESKAGMVVLLRYICHLFPPYTLSICFLRFFRVVAKRSFCYRMPPVLAEICKPDKGHTLSDKYETDIKGIFDYVSMNDANFALCCERVCAPSDTCFIPMKYFDPLHENIANPHLIALLVFLIIQGFIYIGLLLMSESGIVEHFYHNVLLKFIQPRSLTEKTHHHHGADLVTEREKVDKIFKLGKCPKGVVMACSDLTKSYTEHMIINGINIELRRGEIVGLLGGSGCGKSLVIQMLTGKVVPTRGSVLISSYSLFNKRRSYLSSIGYCPQEDAYLHNFTGVQMMELMGKLKGVPPAHLSSHVTKWLKVLDLVDVGREQCSTYSTSVKRRLSGAMALIGGNPLLLLDEPTRGLDASSKQRFWSVVQTSVQRGQGVIFTSFSMDECEKVCSKILVLSEGNVQCIGAPQALMLRFSRGFTLLFRLCFDALTPMEIISATFGRIYDLKKAIEKKIKRAVLRDEQGNLLLYFISDSKMTYGTLFQMAEEIKSDHIAIIESYNISEATLDDVFILLTNKYKDMDKPRSMSSSAPGQLTQFEAETNALEKATKIKKVERN